MIPQHLKDKVHELHAQKLYSITQACLVALGCVSTLIITGELYMRLKIYQTKHDLQDLTQHHATATKKWLLLQQQYKERKALKKQLELLSPALPLHQLLTVLAHTIPSDVILHKIHYTPQKILLYGYADSLDLLDHFITALHTKSVHSTVHRTSPLPRGVLFTLVLTV